MVASLSAFTQLAGMGASPAPKPSNNVISLRGTGQQYFAPPAPQQSSYTAGSAFAPSSSGRSYQPSQPASPSGAFRSLSSSFRGSTVTTPRGEAQPTPKLTPEIQLGLQRLIKSFRTASQKANAANQRRYKQLLKGTEGMQARRAADIKGSLAQREQQLNAEQQQRLQAQGLGGTTIGATLRQGLARDISKERSSALTQLAEQTRAARAGIIERRQDIGPDPAAISSLVGGLAGQFGTENLPTFLKAFQGLQV